MSVTDPTNAGAGERPKRRTKFDALVFCANCRTEYVEQFTFGTQLSEERRGYGYDDAYSERYLHALKAGYTKSTTALVQCRHCKVSKLVLRNRKEPSDAD